MTCRLTIDPSRPKRPSRGLTALPSPRPPQVIKAVNEKMVRWGGKLGGGYDRQLRQPTSVR